MIKISWPLENIHVCWLYQKFRCENIRITNEAIYYVCILRTSSGQQNTLKLDCWPRNFELHSKYSSCLKFSWHWTINHSLVYVLDLVSLLVLFWSAKYTFLVCKLHFWEKIWLKKLKLFVKYPCTKFQSHSIVLWRLMNFYFFYDITPGFTISTVFLAKNAKIRSNKSPFFTNFKLQYLENGLAKFIEWPLIFSHFFCSFKWAYF